jgi:hypothetical protein
MTFFETLFLSVRHIYRLFHNEVLFAKCVKNMIAFRDCMESIVTLTQ